MAKQYFSHDYGARSQLVEIRRDFGLEGVGFFWCIVEILHEQGGYIPESAISGYAYELHFKAEKAQRIIANYGLFDIEQGRVSSKRVLANLRKRNEITEMRRNAASARWEHERGFSSAHEAPVEDNAPIDNGEIVDFYVEQVEQKFADEQEEHEAEWDLDYLEERERAKSILINLIKALKHEKSVRIGKQESSIQHFLERVMYFTTPKGQEELLAVIDAVESKQKDGKVQNLQNYMASALFTHAQLRGG